MDDSEGRAPRQGQSTRQRGAVTPRGTQPPIACRPSEQPTHWVLWGAPSYGMGEGIGAVVKIGEWEARPGDKWTWLGGNYVTNESAWNRLGVRVESGQKMAPSHRVEPD